MAFRKTFWDPPEHFCARIGVPEAPEGPPEAHRRPGLESHRPLKVPRRLTGGLPKHVWVGAPGRSPSELQHSESCAATKQTQALYWLRLPDSVQMWFETTRFVCFVKLKHASRTFFDLKLQRTAFQSKVLPKSAPRAPQELPKRLQSLSKSSPETL